MISFLWSYIFSSLSMDFKHLNFEKETEMKKLFKNKKFKHEKILFIFAVKKSFAFSDFSINNKWMKKMRNIFECFSFSANTKMEGTQTTRFVVIISAIQQNIYFESCF